MGETKARFPQDGLRIIVVDADTIDVQTDMAEKFRFNFKGAPNGGNDGGSGLKSFVPVWKLQSASAHPSIGNGSLLGIYAIDSNGFVDVIISLKIGTSTTLGTPKGTGTSRYYFALPEFLRPANPDFYGGSIQGWIAGAGQKEWTGVPFFYSQIDLALAATLGDVAWNINQPKNLKLGGNTHLTFATRYPFRQA